MKRGEVWVANLNPNRGAEAGKIRPVLILLDDRLLSAGMPVVMVVPLTTRLFAELEPLRVKIPARDKLREDCHAAVEQACALDRRRFGEGPLTTLTAEEMAAVERSLLAVMGIEGAAG